MLAVDSTVIFKSLLVNMHDFKKNSYGISLMEKSGFKRHHYNTVCVPSPIPNQSHTDHKDLLQFFQASIINLPVTELLLHLSRAPWAKSPARLEEGERKKLRRQTQRASSFSPPHLKTSSLYNQHHHQKSLYLGAQLSHKNRELQMEPKEPLCVCMLVCVFGARSCQSVHLPVKAI